MVGVFFFVLILKGKGRSVLARGMGSKREKDSLSDMFRCMICLEHVNDPRLCPGCGVCFCRKCVERWLQTHRTCPCCRVPVVVGSLASGRLIEEVRER